MRVVVIGAGLGGLACAVRLQALGCEVTVLEQDAGPGGRAGRLRSDGFTWDTGPSLITMPWVLEQTFAAGGLDLHRELNLHRLDPLYRIRWAADGAELAFHSSREGLEAEVARLNPRDAGQVAAFLEALRPIYEQGILGAGQRPIQDLDSFLRLIPMMSRLRAAGPLHRFVARYFADERVRQAFSFHSLFIGGDPFRVPAIYGALVYLQVLDGGWYSDGGVYSIVQALAAALDIRYDCRATAVDVREGVARGVRTAGGERFAADAVVFNGDVLRLDALLGRTRGIRALVPTMSCFLLYLGLSRRQPSLDHHTLLVGPRYRDFIETVTHGRGLPSTLSTYVHAPARTEPSMAIAGGDSLAILLPVPNLDADIEWARAAPELRDRVLADLEQSFGMRELRRSIVSEHWRTPLDFRDRFGAVAGNAFSVEPTLQQSALLRPGNRVRGVQSLYRVGAGTHPGAGIPGVLLGAAITTSLIGGDHGLREVPWD